LCGSFGIATCNARGLRAFLESKAQFANWIKDLIEQYGFEEGKGFRSNLSKSRYRPRRLRGRF